MTGRRRKRKQHACCAQESCRCDSLRPASRNCGRCQECDENAVREDPRRQQGAPLEERAGTRQTLGATEGTSGGAGVSHAAATEKRGSVKTAKRNARRKGERHRRQAAKAGGAADVDAFPTQVDETNISQLIAQALVLKFQYL